VGEHEREIRGAYIRANRSTPLQGLEERFDIRRQQCVDLGHIGHELIRMQEHLRKKDADKRVMGLLHLPLETDVLREHGGQWPIVAEAAEPGLDLSLEPGHERDDDVFFGVEVVVDGAFADVRGIGDLVDGDSVDPPLREQLDRYLNNVVASDHLFPGSPANYDHGRK
jgi:hypothetical protein